MDLTKFNEDLLPAPFGFNNYQNICHLNALIQILITCTSFSNKILSSKTNNQVIKILFYIIFESIYNLKDKTNYFKKEKLDIKYCTGFLIEALQKHIKDANIYGAIKSNPHEGLVLLISILEKDIEISKLFLLKYEIKNMCKNCGYVNTINDSRHYIFVTNDNINESLLKTKENLHDYKCEKCKNNKIIQNTKLKKVSEIITFVNENFDLQLLENMIPTERKNVRNEIVFPDNLIIPGKNQLQLVYKKISQINYSYHGEHYTATCLRENFDWITKRTNKSIYHINDNYVYKQNYFENDPYMVFYHFEGVAHI